MRVFEWEPGNATRYQLAFVEMSSPREGVLVVGGAGWIETCGGPYTGAMLLLPTQSTLFPDRVREKMRQTSEGDAVAVTDFIGRVLNIKTVLPDWWQPQGEPRYIGTGAVARDGLTANDWQAAIDVQSAVNLSGVAHSFSRLMSKLYQHVRQQDEPFSTIDVNQHPLAILYAVKMQQLATGTHFTDGAAGDAFSYAYQRALEEVGHEREKEDTD